MGSDLGNCMILKEVLVNSGALVPLICVYGYETGALVQGADFAEDGISLVITGNGS